MVTNVTIEQQVGFSSPITLEGTIVVDGLVVTTYADAKLPAIDNHRMMHNARVAYLATRTILPPYLCAWVIEHALFVWRPLDYVLTSIMQW